MAWFQDVAPITCWMASAPSTASRSERKVACHLPPVVLMIDRSRSSIAAEMALTGVLIAGGGGNRYALFSGKLEISQEG